MTVIGWIIVGLLVGWLVGMVLRGRGYGIVTDIIIGLVGALIGGFLAAALLGINLGGPFDLVSIVIAFVGALILVLLWHTVTGRRPIWG